jgi:signal transduction histidine kinase
MYPTVVPIVAAEAVRAYETGGPDAFARFAQTNVDDKERILYLLDGFNQDALHRPVSSDGLKTAQAAKSGQLLILRGQIAAYRFTSPSGRPYVLLLYMETSLLNELKDVILAQGILFVLSLILIVTLLCLWLAYHIASPIYAIQSAAREVTSGDLSARAPVQILKCHDELATDFNFMVQKIEILLRGHKDLLAAVSHEIRSPLARLSLSIALLRKERHSTAEDLLVRMDRDIGVLDVLMSQLLTLSRFETGISGPLSQKR